MAEIARADANASRAFFVRMLTRDITVEDCILDLIDNSVDSAWKALGQAPLGLQAGPDFSGVEIAINATPQEFRITDNSGGMSLQSAQKYAFTFGRKARDPDDDSDFSIGVYGIGLKRAIFKLGRSIVISSTHDFDGVKQTFRVPINVAEWVKDEASKDWDFPIQDAPALEADGLDIHVTDLTDLAQATFEDSEFPAFLRRTISRDYALHLHRGLKVTVNGKVVEGELFQVFSGSGFEPLYQSYSELVGKERVDVEILAGFAFPPPDDNDPDRSRREREEKSGWYVACNGRIVMAADKTSLSVWGDDFPSWHPQYTGFFGIVLFSAENTELLPLTTTKRSVDLSSVVYRRARPKMKEPTRTWIDYTNARKNEQEVARSQEAAAKQTPIFSVSKSPNVSVPRLKRSQVKETSIQFRMPVARVKNLAIGFGDPRMSNGDVGRNAFDHAYDDLVGEE